MKDYHLELLQAIESASQQQIRAMYALWQLIKEDNSELHDYVVGHAQTGSKRYKKDNAK